LPDFFCAPDELRTRTFRFAFVDKFFCGGKPFFDRFNQTDISGRRKDVELRFDVGIGKKGKYHIRFFGIDISLREQFFGIKDFWIKFVFISISVSVIVVSVLIIS